MDNLFDRESEESRFCREVDKFAQHCVEEAGSGLSDEDIPYYRERFFEFQDFEWTPANNAEFEESFRSAWNFYLYRDD